MIDTRKGMALGFAACAGGLVFAYYLQYWHGLEPCPMCIFQRVAMAAAGLVFLLGAIHAPRTLGRRIYALLAALCSSVGAAIAGRHVWLQSLPADQVPACGPPLDHLMQVLPFMEVISFILRGEGSCAKIAASFLGLSIPAWTLMAFVAIALWALLLIRLPANGDAVN